MIHRGNNIDSRPWRLVYTQERNGPSDLAPAPGSITVLLSAFATRMHPTFISNSFSRILGWDVSKLEAHAIEWTKESRKSPRKSTWSAQKEISRPPSCLHRQMFIFRSPELRHFFALQITLSSPHNDIARNTGTRDFRWSTGVIRDGSIYVCTVPWYVHINCISGRSSRLAASTEKSIWCNVGSFAFCSAWTIDQGFWLINTNGVNSRIRYPAANEVVLVLVVVAVNFPPFAINSTK